MGCRVKLALLNKVVEYITVKVGCFESVSDLWGSQDRSVALWDVTSCHFSKKMTGGRQPQFSHFFESWGPYCWWCFSLCGKMLYLPAHLSYFLESSFGKGLGLNCSVYALMIQWSVSRPLQCSAYPHFLSASFFVSGTQFPTAATTLATSFLILSAKVIILLWIWHTLTSISVAPTNNLGKVINSKSYLLVLSFTCFGNITDNKIERSLIELAVMFLLWSFLRVEAIFWIDYWKKKNGYTTSWTMKQTVSKKMFVSFPIETVWYSSWR